MTEQLQSERKSTLDARSIATTPLGKIDPRDLAKVRPADTVLKQALGNEHRPILAQPLDRNIDLIFATIELTELKLGNSLLQVQHSTERTNRHKPYYSTTITNRSTEKIRIDLALISAKGKRSYFIRLRVGILAHNNFMSGTMWVAMVGSNQVDRSQTPTITALSISTGLILAPLPAVGNLSLALLGVSHGGRFGKLYDILL
jgi:hypothetical protein